MKYAIRNMVCNRCIMVVTSLFEKHGVTLLHLELGEATTKNEISSGKLDALKSDLKQVGFEVIDDKKTQVIEKIKNVVIELVHHSDEELKVNLSDYLSKKLGYDYNYLSNLFSETESTTIEKYFISQRIEKVKELLVYDELSLSEIADKLNYSSVAYLSSQFKKVTGLTPSFFKSLKDNKRKKIEEL